MDNPQPNAFATGRNPQHAAVAASTGLLEMLSRDEIAGVISHELAQARAEFQGMLTDESDGKPDLAGNPN